MKKYLLLLLAFLPMLVFNSCSSDEKENNNIIVGSKWENKTYYGADKSRVESVTTITFTSNTSMIVSVDGDYDSVEGFETHNSATVQYSFNEGNLSATYNGYNLTGTISGNSMTIKQTSDGGSEIFVFNKIQ